MCNQMLYHLAMPPLLPLVIVYIMEFQGDRHLVFQMYNIAG